jgi:flavin reductase (DIM6/NTAB) family NADH-FMN oxidoreductase RutF/DNA-binding MarR family transcriptional regulator
MNETKPAFDKRAFRAALGRFPTGVTVVTTRTPEGKRVGLTASSFNSVSLDPPLVLWSLAKSAASVRYFMDAPHYAVNVLAADQIGLSRQFASSHADRFAGVACSEGLGGVPLIDGCAAWFECNSVHQYEGGDHIILVGHVERFAEADRSALAFHLGGYKVTSHHPESDATARKSQDFIDDYLLYLLARASSLASGQFHELLKAREVPVPRWRVLATLSDGEALTISALARIVLLKQPTLTKVIDRMEKAGLVERGTSPADGRHVLVHITREGRRAARELLKLAKTHESELLAAYGEAESVQLKAILRTLIERLAEGGDH